MNKKKTYQHHLIVLSIILVDVVFIVISDLTSFIVRFNGAFPPVNFEAYSNLAFFIITLRLISFYVFSLYESPKYKSNLETFINIMKAASASSLIIISVVYFFDIKSYPRSIVSLSWLFTIVYISSWRFFIKEFLQVYLGKDFFRSHLLIIGTGRHAKETAIHALRDASIEYSFVGYVSLGNSSHLVVDKKEVLGTLNDLPSILENNTVDEILIAEPDIGKNEMARLANLIGDRRISLKSLPSTYETVISNMISYDRGIPFSGPTIFVKPISWYWGVKRILDIILSIAITILTLPVWLISIMLIKATSPGPVLYFQKRTGMNGVRFTMLKLRTMYANAEKKGRPLWAKKEDKRITPIGKLLRRFRIDELPQLINVLRNEMSIIGPRPERPYFSAKLVKKIPLYSERLRAKPGITGWAQVNFRYAATEEDSEKKLLYDIFYIHNMSFALDFLIALKTFKVIMAGTGAR